ncbi:MAG: cadmium-translocating P-type ATPase [Patescibacteria group bacterium]|nr:cadmium-translocating P-type ATPase [Patescibacteria group bacterium]
MNKKVALLNTFKVPAIILLGIVLYVILELVKFPLPAAVVAVSITLLGSYRLVKESVENLLHRRYALDYIAILAIVVSLITKEYIVAAILALMIESGRTLEDYGVAQAKKSLTKLAERIPNEVTLWENKRAGIKISIGKVKKGDLILIRKGEVIGLDGILESEAGFTDEASLTGEPYAVEKIKGDPIRSGTINVGDPIIVKVLKLQTDSTYNKIIELVKKAQDEKSPFVRMADKYSGYFTIVTLVITGFSYVYSGFDLTRALAVLVIATPCPLIIATPIALLGGVNAASKRNIIVKKLASIEVLSRAKSLIFDKTGTITLGKPRVVEFFNRSKYQDAELLAISESIERNSLHPLAKAVVEFAKGKNAKIVHAEKIEEKVGQGISGTVSGKRYKLSKLEDKEGMAIGIYEGSMLLAGFRFEDEIKQESKSTIQHLKNWGFELFIFTGDKKEAAKKLVKNLNLDVTIKAECTPEDKQEGINNLKKQGKITAMVGDGINDAPALALADVGMVFSNEEQTAASEAADIVFLGGNFSLVIESVNISKKTIKIAKQSIFFGIGLSVLGMVFASFGLVHPIGGAFLQEAIDVAVIINALRASR